MRYTTSLTDDARRALAHELLLFRAGMNDRYDEYAADHPVAPALTVKGVRTLIALRENLAAMPYRDVYPFNHYVLLCSIEECLDGQGFARPDDCDVVDGNPAQTIRNFYLRTGLYQDA